MSTGWLYATGTAKAMPADTSNDCKTEWDASELSDHPVGTSDVEEELVATDW